MIQPLLPPRRVLLSSVTGPLGPRHGDGPAVGHELLHAQVTRAQGIFSPRAVHNQYGIDTIAANLDTPTVTLHYPTEAGFVRELRTGNYSHVGIAFNLSTSHRMRRMSALVREHAPQATLVLGGYGTVMTDEELSQWGDVWCRGEGVSFMRDLLGELPREPPFDHPLELSTMRIYGVPASKTGIVFAGLGCPNGCDFCCTSHYYKRKHVKLLPTGRDIFEVVKAYRELDPVVELTVLDEDFLLDRRRAFELRDLVQEAGIDLNMFVFASVKALSMYTPEQLVEIGVGGVWVGYEGTRSGYAKQKGRPLDELFADLRNHGVMTLASMIVGLDYQTPEIIRQEHAGLMALNPTLTQFLIYGPTPGTPLGERTEKEGRWLPRYANDERERWRRSDGFAALTTHPHMSPDEMESMQQWCFDEDFRRLGPSIVRTIETWVTGWEHLRQATAPALVRRRDYLARRIAGASAVLGVAEVLGPNASTRRIARDVHRRANAMMSMAERLKASALGLAGFGAAAATALDLRWELWSQPAPLRIDWSTSDRPVTARFSRVAVAAK